MFVSGSPRHGYSEKKVITQAHGKRRQVKVTRLKRKPDLGFQVADNVSQAVKLQLRGPQSTPPLSPQVSTHSLGHQGSISPCGGGSTLISANQPRLVSMSTSKTRETGGETARSVRVLVARGTRV